MFDNLILNSDSYKYSHFLQYPADTTGLFGYIEARTGDEIMFFGLQSILQEYLSKPITHEMIDEAKAIITAHGEPFNEEGFRKIVDQYNGYLPFKIRAIEEGTVVKAGVAMMTIESSCLDLDICCIASMLESLLLRVWYTCTVATTSFKAKKMIREYLVKTSDNSDVMSSLVFKLHDFGARGVSSTESAALGGMSHLVNFQGTDTVLGLLAAKRYYACDMAGFSIPAAEHSTITSWGRERELDAYSNMVDKFGQPGKIFAVVSDSYDLENAVTNIWGEALKDKVIASGATLVIRPDSGKPEEVVLSTLKSLAASYGYVVNSKGYKVLNNVRVIQGDGINLDSIKRILDIITSDENKFCADNIAFGMGGALLQQLNRDTFSFAMKFSARQINCGEWVGFNKEPITDLGKKSKKGRLTTVQDVDGSIFTIDLDKPDEANLANLEYSDIMSDVWVNDKIVKRMTFDQVRSNASVA